MTPQSMSPRMRNDVTTVALEHEELKTQSLPLIPWYHVHSWLPWWRHKNWRVCSRATTRGMDEFSLHLVQPLCLWTLPTSQLLSFYIRKYQRNKCSNSLGASQMTASRTVKCPKQWYRNVSNDAGHHCCICYYFGCLDEVISHYDTVTDVSLHTWSN
jgi:hypothetical protein